MAPPSLYCVSHGGLGVDTGWDFENSTTYSESEIDKQRVGRKLRRR